MRLFHSLIQNIKINDLIKILFATNFFIYSFHPISYSLINKNITEYGLRIDLLISFFIIFIIFQLFSLQFQLHALYVLLIML